MPLEFWILFLHLYIKFTYIRLETVSARTGEKNLIGSLKRPQIYLKMVHFCGYLPVFARIHKWHFPGQKLMDCKFNETLVSDTYYLLYFISTSIYSFHFLAEDFFLHFILYGDLAIIHIYNIFNFPHFILYMDLSKIYIYNIIIIFITFVIQRTTLSQSQTF